MIDRQQPHDLRFRLSLHRERRALGHDLAGKAALVTGGYSGLGLETVRTLSGAGFTLSSRPAGPMLRLRPSRTCRGHGRRSGPRQSWSRWPPSPLLGARRGTPVDLVLNVAGVMAPPAGRTPQGWESQFGTNHLGHFALVGGIAGLPADRPGDPRIRRWRTTVRRSGSAMSVSRRSRDPWVAYSQSKTANALFAVALDARGAGGHPCLLGPPGGIADRPATPWTRPTCAPGLGR